jgi:hypothetical protein
VTDATERCEFIARLGAKRARWRRRALSRAFGLPRHIASTSKQPGNGDIFIDVLPTSRLGGVSWLRRYNGQLQAKMREAQMNREAVLVIAELMWALRRSGAHTFFPSMPLHKARKLVLVGATVGLAHLRGRPVTLASLSRQLEMPPATTERRLQELMQAGWVYRRGGRYLLRLERLEEPTYAIYFTHAERAVVMAGKKLQALHNTNMPKMGTLPSHVA